MLERFDSYCWSKEKKDITFSNHNVKALGNFSHWNYTSAHDSVPMHYHTNAIEIHCMIKGKRTSQIMCDNEIHNYTYYGNEIFITFPNEVHGSGKQPQLPCEFYAIQIFLDNPDELLGLNKEYSNTLYNLLTTLKHRHLKLGHENVKYIRMAFNMFSNIDNSNYIQAGVQFLSCFLFSLQFLVPIDDSINSKRDESIQKALKYLEDNIHESLRLSDLADVSGYSLSRFKVRFREELGMTPAEYITSQKLEYAKKQLSTTDVNITDLAYSLGFSSSSYFSAVFKKYTECTPKEYRNLYFSSDDEKPL